jgi:hypothetical protein
MRRCVHEGAGIAHWRTAGLFGCALAGRNDPATRWSTSAINNYRLTPEETAYIVEDSDAVLVWVDAEYADGFTRIRSQIPRVREIVVFGGAVPPGITTSATARAT